MISALAKGASYLEQGRKLNQHPSIRPFVWIPLIFNMVLFAFATYYAITWIYQVVMGLSFQYDFVSWLDWLEPIVAGFAGFFGWILVVAGALLVLFVVGSTFTMVTNLLASPFLGLLAEKVEARIHTPSFVEHTIAQLLWRTLKRELRKLSYLLVRVFGLGMITLVLWFIPGLNMINPVLWFLFGSWVMAMQYVDIAADNNGVPFQETLALLRGRRSEAMGFGGVVMLLVSVPVINWFIVPVAVAGGVVFFVTHYSPVPQNSAVNVETKKA
ncbi:Hypothetical protein HDN1F_15010 [gamma proteobacterium HdN1]|nr:Hypothetical protein HDN1F_15010 [gamma proteobacterium HdN1]